MQIHVHTVAYINEHTHVQFTVKSEKYGSLLVPAWMSCCSTNPSEASCIGNPHTQIHVGILISSTHTQKSTIMSLLSCVTSVRHPHRILLRNTHTTCVDEPTTTDQSEKPRVTVTIPFLTYMYRAFRNPSNNRYSDWTFKSDYEQKRHFGTNEGPSLCNLARL